MTIQEWLSSGCDYDQGVILYARFGKNKLLLRRFYKGKSAYNVEKLKYELSKLGAKKVSSPVKAAPPAVSPAPRKTPDTVIESSPALKFVKSKPISFYPLELHPVYQLRVQSFYEAASLKVQLNDLAEEDEEKALEIQQKIWKAIKENIKCWELLDYYDKTGQVLPTESDKDFSKLSPQGRVNQRQRLYANRSKRTKTLKKKQLKLDKETNSAKREKLETFIRRKKQELQVIENDIDKLSELINDQDEVQ